MTEIVDVWRHSQLARLSLNSQSTCFGSNKRGKMSNEWQARENTQPVTNSARVARSKRGKICNWPAKAKKATYVSSLQEKRHTNYAYKRLFSLHLRPSLVL